MRLIDADELLDITVTVANEEMAEFVQNQSFTYRELVVAETTRRFFEAITTIIADAPTAYDMEKYKWHDLRKNPEDLPENETLCDVLVDFGDCTEYGIARKNEAGFYDCFSDSDGCVGEANIYHEGVSVIAWRYIEPFDEVE